MIPTAPAIVASPPPHSPFMLACTPLINDSPVSSATLGSATIHHHHTAATLPLSLGNDTSLTNHTRGLAMVCLSAAHASDYPAAYSTQASVTRCWSVGRELQKGCGNDLCRGGGQSEIGRIAQRHKKQKEFDTRTSMPVTYARTTLAV